MPSPSPTAPTPLPKTTLTAPTPAIGVGARTAVDGVVADASVVSGACINTTALAGGVGIWASTTTPSLPPLPATPPPVPSKAESEAVGWIAMLKAMAKPVSQPPVGRARADAADSGVVGLAGGKALPAARAVVAEEGVGGQAVGITVKAVGVVVATVVVGVVVAGSRPVAVELAAAELAAVVVVVVEGVGRAQSEGWRNMMAPSASYLLVFSTAPPCRAGDAIKAGSASFVTAVGVTVTLVVAGCVSDRPSITTTPATVAAMVAAGCGRSVLQSEGE